VSIRASGISYAIGAAAWGAKAQQEGLMVTEHSEPEQVTDTQNSHEVAKSQRMPDARDCSIGTLYYLWNLQTIFTPAHACLLLDKFFEGTAIGAASQYTRNYQAEDIFSEPATPYINLWKKTGKVGHDVCCYNGLVTGISLAKSQGNAMTLGARCAFGSRSFAEADPGLWAINRTSGDITPPTIGSGLFFVATPGGSWTAFKVTDFNVNLSGEFTPHFWGAQTPDRFTRGKVALAGDIQLRDIVDQVETFSAWLEGSTARSCWLYFGANASLRMNVKINSGGASEDEITRTGKFGFTGVYESAATYPSGFRFALSPGRAYTP
jgi:hypothetical protein